MCRDGCGEACIDESVLRLRKISKIVLVYKIILILRQQKNLWLLFSCQAEPCWPCTKGAAPQARGRGDDGHAEVPPSHHAFALCL